MKLSTEEVEFSFNNVLYRQIDGIAIESPLRPTLANIFMGHLEYNILSDFNSRCTHVRYVDDSLLVTVKNLAC